MIPMNDISYTPDKIKVSIIISVYNSHEIFTYPGAGEGQDPNNLFHKLKRFEQSENKQ